MKLPFKLGKEKPPDYNKDYRFRDVYSDQRRERSKIGKKTSYVPWQVLSGSMALCAMILAWLVLSSVTWTQAWFSGKMPAGWNPEVPAVELGFGGAGGSGESVAGEGTEVSDVGDGSQGTGGDMQGSGSASGNIDGDVASGPGSGVSRSDMYARVRGMDLDTFLDAYFTFYRNEGGALGDRIYVSNATGERYKLLEISNAHHIATNGGSSDEFDRMLGLVVDDSIVEPETPMAGPDDGSDGSLSLFGNRQTPSMGWCIRQITFMKVMFTLMVGLVVYALLDKVFRQRWKTQNLLNDTEEINQYENDQFIQTPEEIQKAYNWFPDVGAHAPIQVSSLISHMALSNKGLKSVMLTRRAEKDITDKDGAVVYFKGEALEDEDGEIIQDKRPMIDEAFMDSLWDASFLPKDKSLRRRFDPTGIPYNPGDENRDKLKGAETVADMINKYWTLPDYEPQRPGGAYIVDTDPVNTMVLAITRAGKGQTIIEPTLDMWTREAEPNNMVINDPKGELLVRFYVRGTVRGFQIVQFNLINSMKTDIYNPLILAADAAREGDFMKCAQYVENIAEVFFPLDGGDDPLWPNAANNAFKRTAYGLIEYYMEEEKELRRFAERTGMDPQLLDTRIDELWGRVTLYNAYQMFVQLTAKKLTNPSVEFKKRAKNGDFDSLKPGEDPNSLPPNRCPMDDEEYEEYKSRVIQMAECLWEDKPEQDLLTLYFNATSCLPKNQMRTLVDNADRSLRAAGGAEKMLASIYGIAITAMSFFTDPTISTLTSGTPSQNVDLGGLSFPRRFGVRFDQEFLKRNALVGMQAKWDAYEDRKFEKPLGKDFHHDDMVSREGWAMYYFKGKFEKELGYLRLQIVNPATEMVVKTFYFEFKKAYQKSLNGQYYVTDPVTQEKIVKNGIITELRKATTKSGEERFKKAKTTFRQTKIVDVLNNPIKEAVDMPAIIQTMCRYSEKPKMVFLVTPPHLMKYAKLILILITQLVNLNFDKSYMTKSNQKPLYKTRFMLDELGNLQSEGHGIANFQTMLSIGLG